MNLSGTVTIPPRLPDVAEISFTIIGKKEVVVVTQKLSPKLVIKRTFFLSDVASVFLPQNCESVDLTRGEWFEDKVLAAKAEYNLDKDPVKGIVYVRENAPSMLEVQAGMTAAESAEYYPPLPDDRSVNHYDMDGDQSLYGRLGKPACGYHG
jgi:hypothetical protein